MLISFQCYLFYIHQEFVFLIYISIEQLFNYNTSYYEKKIACFLPVQFKKNPSEITLVM